MTSCYHGSKMSGSQQQGVFGLFSQRRIAKKAMGFILPKTNIMIRTVESYCVLLFRGKDFPFLISSVQAVVPWPIRRSNVFICTDIPLRLS